MTQQLILAAHHEAGHAVATIFSRFHNLPHGFSAHANGHGDNAAGLSRRRCEAAGKSPSKYDEEMAIDLAVIACAGYEAEKRCAVELGCDPDVGAANEDYQLASQVLGNADLTLAKKEAAALIDQRWAEVKTLASALVAAPGRHLWGAEAYDILGVPIP